MATTGVETLSPRDLLHTQDTLKTFSARASCTRINRRHSSRRSPSTVVRTVLGQPCFCLMVELPIKIMSVTLYLLPIEAGILHLQCALQKLQKGLSNNSAAQGHLMWRCFSRRTVCVQLFFSFSGTFIDWAGPIDDIDQHFVNEISPRPENSAITPLKHRDLTV